MLGVYSHIVLFAVGYFASFLFQAEKDTKSLTFYGWMSERNQKNGDITV
jgi:SSS family solute:Na+ symporter